MTSSARMFRHRILRLPRKAMVMLVLATYLFAGALHGLCGIDVTSPTGERSTVISMVDHAIGHSDKAMCADDHCHGCFSVSLPATTVAVLSLDAVVDSSIHHDAKRGGLLRGLEPPPPRSLT